MNCGERVSMRHTALALLICSLLQGSDLLAKDALVFRNATIYDGSGAPPVIGHVSIDKGKITSLGQGDGPEATWVIDAKGLVIAPGFIDLHTHSDPSVTSVNSRACTNYIMQGCTTSVTGNCGSGPVDVADYYKKINTPGAGTNVAHLLPQGSLRSQVVGSENRKPTPEELAKMRALAKKAMDDGAWGMSTGLIYLPGSYSSTEELIEIASEIAAGGGFYASHIRGEASTLLPSILEAIEIGEKAGCPTHISHIKAADTPNWGSIGQAIALIETAQRKGLKVTADQYPYTAFSTTLEPTIFPNWARSGGRKELIARLNDPETGPKIREEVAREIKTSDDGRQVVISSCSRYPQYVGKNLYEIGQMDKITATEAVEKITRAGGARIVKFAMSEDDVRTAMTYPWVATASDASAGLPTADRPHPRGYGTFPRKIGHYAIREQVISLEQAIRSATGLPADILGFKDRGYLKTGYAADIVVFDPQSFIDKATFEEPYQYAEGMQFVLVNGTMAVYKGTPTGALAGRALQKNADQKTAK